MTATAGDLRGVLRRTEGGAILPDHTAEVSRGHSTISNGGKARTVDRSRALWWSREMASGEVLGGMSGIWDERAAGTPGEVAPVGVVALTPMASAEPPET
jgi:hypothetical protein